MIEYPTSIVDAIRTAESRTGRQISGNTWLVDHRRNEPDFGGPMAVRYHATDVVTFFQNGDVRLDTGGWFTLTTKGRINACSPAWQTAGAWTIWQVDSEWFLNTERGTFFFESEHIMIRADGELIGSHGRLSPIEPSYRTANAHRIVVEASAS